MDKLRSHYHEVLLIDDDANFTVIKDKLIQLHKFGMLNLSLNPLDWTIADLKQQCLDLQKKCRSVTAQLRESRKRYKRASEASTTHYERATRAELERDEYRRLLTVAQSQLSAFRVSHPDWKPPTDVLLKTADADDAMHIFKQLEGTFEPKTLIDKQMEIDPSGLFLISLTPPREITI